MHGSTGGGWKRNASASPRQLPTQPSSWMTTLVDLDTGVVLGVVDGRGSAGVKAWLTARSAPWLGGAQVVAIDPSVSGNDS